MTRIFVFPGHGSQRVGIGQDLFARYPDLVREADSVLGYSVEDLCLRGPAERLSDNRFTQPAMYVVGALSYLDRVADGGRLPDAVAGHSLGEYVALFAAGTFDFRTGLELVSRRAELMNAEPTGAVIAVIGLAPRRIRELLDLHGFRAVDFSGLNSPEQTALAGPREELSKAAEVLGEEAEAVFWISRTSASHSRYGEPAAREFREVLASYALRTPQFPVISNVTAQPYGAADEIADLLVRQLTHPVRWTETVQYLSALPAPEFHEIGPGTVLTGLIRTIRERPAGEAPAGEVRIAPVDVTAFAVASGDNNPLHTDAGYSHTTPFGEPIAHGVLGVFSALAQLPAAPDRRLRLLRARFQGPLFPGRSYRAAVSGPPDSAAVRVTDGNHVLLEVEAVFEEGAVGAGRLPLDADTGPLPVPAPADVPWSELVPGLTTHGPYVPDTRQLGELVERFGLAARGVGQDEAAALAWTSRLIGTRIPGRSALFRELSVEFSRPGPDSDQVHDRDAGRRDDPAAGGSQGHAEVTGVDRDLRMVWLDGELTMPGLTARAELQSFVRQDPAAPSADLVARLSPPGRPLAGKVALVVGGSRGLGASLALALLDQGCTVYIGFRRSGDAAERLRAGLGAGAQRLLLLPGDAADTEWCQAARSRILAEQGRLDILVLSACPPVNVVPLDSSGDERAAAYLAQSMALVRTPLAAMAQEISARGGWSVVISSPEVSRPSLGWSHYATAKHAVEGFVQAAAREYPDGHFLIVRPPRLDTSLTNPGVGRAARRTEPVAVAVVNRIQAGPDRDVPGLMEEFPDAGAAEFEAAASGLTAPAAAPPAARLVVAATFVAEPVADVLRFWDRQLDLGLEVEFAQYDQVFQSLLDPVGPFGSNDRGVNVVLLRLEDWLTPRSSDQAVDWEAARTTADEFSRAVEHLTGSSRVPLLVCLCPPSPLLTADKGRRLMYADLERGLGDRLRALPGVHVLADDSWHGAYAVPDGHDPAREEMAHIPYTPEAFTALGTSVMRGVHAVTRTSFKALVLDCDNTLWAGAVGEEGTDGIRIGPGHRYLQQYAADLSERGILVCLCSKNAAEDVTAVFEAHPGMPLTPGHLAASRVNWEAKSDNIRSLAEELGIGADGIVFLDDNPMEVAEVRAGVPEAVSLQLPAEPEHLPAFVDHLWAFDRLTVTAEDRLRTEAYQVSGRRKEAERTAISFASFIESLDLRIEVQEPPAEKLGRVSQLSLRTNQFNLTALRLTETEIRDALTRGHTFWTAEVSDRFGDYGLVGTVMFHQRADRLVVDNLLLSCRALGRGVEHAILARVGEFAVRAGLVAVEISCLPTDRNEPARRFLADVAAGFEVAPPSGDGAQLRYRVPAGVLADVTFRPQDIAPAAVDAEPGAAVDAVAAQDRRMRAADLPVIAYELNDTALIDARLRGVPAQDPAPALAGVTTVSDPAADGTERLFAAACALVAEEIGRVLPDLPVEPGPDTTFDRLRLTSFMIVDITVALEKMLGRLPKTLFFEFQTIAGIGGYLVEKCAGPLSRLTGLPAARTVPAKARTRPVEERAVAVPEDPIAIVGLAGRYPGAGNVEQLWDLLAKGGSAVGEIPAERWDHSRYYDADGGDEGKTHSKWAALMDGIDRFDSLFFGISPREAELMDPQQRLFLEVAYEAMQDAGHTRESLGDEVGVYVGAMANDYGLLSAEAALKGDSPYPYAVNYQLANRVSYFLDFTGPSLTVDTACSSSLVAVHLACEALRQGGVSAAIAGGVNVIAHPSRHIQYGNMGMLSRTGACNTFGEGADGIVLGEGVGAVVLKRLRQAQADGDHIHGVIRGSWTSSQGRTSGFTVPSPESQASLITHTLDLAGLAPRSVNYVEAHGTGTSLGDPIEIRGLARAFETDSGAAGPCAVGSVKTNIGHLESAAGIAGLTKVLLQLRHGSLAPSPHSGRTNPYIDFASTPFFVPQELAPWPRVIEGRQGAATEAPLRAGVSAFGAGGVIAHVVVEEPPRAEESRRPTRNPCELIVLSANSPQALTDYARRLHVHLSDRPFDLTDVAYTLRAGREALPVRVAFVARCGAELLEALEKLVHNGPAGVPGAVSGTVRDGGTPVDVLPEGWSDLADLWCRGGDIPWDRLPGHGVRRRVQLPTYPFARARHWLPRPAGAGPDAPEAQRAQTVRAAPATRTAADAPLVTACTVPGAQDDPQRLLAAGSHPLVAVLTGHLHRMVAELTKITPEDVDPARDFAEFGMDSVMRARLSGLLNKELDMQLSVVVLFDYPSVELLARHLVHTEEEAISRQIGRPE
ncbi:ACP S-malonyltransferase [Streptomyces sioyaensis]|uniref:ACP S-malonyltransferase n=1 Tax=Streptomyces sioyaensis TaxID=67364 RepID=UPI00368CF369